jgi:PTS system N-acetylglucosamine-specific IIC component
MYHAARPERRAGVAGLLLSLALTSFLTGVTEPIEFTFMFLAPLLYAVHAVATGLAMVIMDLFGVRLGFSFSAGLFDYLLNFSHAQRPLLLLPIGLAYSALYYVVFRYCIARFDLATPGRERDEGATARPQAVPAGDRGGAFVAALGGAANLAEVEACTTRLRLVIVDGAAVDEAALRRLGARGVVRPSATGLQVVLGPIADQVAGEIRATLRSPPPPPSTTPAAPAALLAALGGRGNLLALSTAPGRLLLTVAREEAVDDQALTGLGARGIARPAAGVVHVLVRGAVEDTAAPLRTLLGAG